MAAARIINTASILKSPLLLINKIITPNAPISNPKISFNLGFSLIKIVDIITVKNDWVCNITALNPADNPVLIP